MQPASSGGISYFSLHSVPYVICCASSLRIVSTGCVKSTSTRLPRYELIQCLIYQISSFSVKGKLSNHSCFFNAFKQNRQLQGQFAILYYLLFVFCPGGIRRDSVPKVFSSEFDIIFRDCSE